MHSGASAQGLDATFTTPGTWPTGWTGTSTNIGAKYDIADGNLNITMGKRTDGVYLGAFQWTGNLAVSTTENQILAIKFIGQVPANNVSVAVTNTAGVTATYYRDTKNQTMTTRDGNTIYYYKLGTQTIASGKQLELPCDVNKIVITPSSGKTSDITSCVIDWVKTFATVDDLKDNINIGDDDPYDDDDAHTDPVVLIGSDKYYSLSDAWKNATSGQTLTLQKDVFVDARLTTDGRNLTIDGNGNKLINRVAAYTGIMFQTTAGLTSSTVGNLTLKNLTINGGKIDGRNQLIDVYNGGTVTLMDVSFTNCVNSNSNSANLGIINARSGNLNLTNVTIDATCTVADGYGQINAASNGVTLRGTCNFSLFLYGSAFATNNGMTAGKVTLEVNLDPSVRNLDAVLIKNVTDNDTKFFELPAVEDYENYVLIVKDGGLYLKDNSKKPEDFPFYIIDNGTAISGFTSFAGAWNAASTSETIVINEIATDADLVVNEALDAKGRTLIVNGNNKTLTRGTKFTATMFLASTSEGKVTLNDLTIDGGNIATSSQVISLSGSSVFSLNNVNILNASTNNTFGLISVRSGCTLNVNGLTFTGSTTSASNTGDIAVYSNGVNLQGLCNFTLFVANSFAATNKGIAEGSKIALAIDPATRVTSVPVLNAVAVTEKTDDNDKTYYEPTNDYYSVATEGYKIFIKKDDVKDGVGNIYIVLSSYQDPENALLYVEGHENEADYSFYTFADAWKYAISNSGTTFILTADVTIGTRQSMASSTATFKSAEGKTYTISRETANSGVIIELQGGNVTFENINFDGKGGNTTLLTVPKGTLNLTNVNISNANQTGYLGVIYVYSAGILNANSLTIEGTVPAGEGQIYNNNSNIFLSGDCTFSVFVDAANHLNNSGMTGGEVTVMFYTTNASRNRDLTKSIVNGVDETSEKYFVCGVEGESFELNEGDLYIFVPKVIIAKIGDAEYETLQEAWTAAQSGDVIELLGKATVNASLRAEGRTLTIVGTTSSQKNVKSKAGEEETTEPTIARAPTFKNSMIIASTNGADVTLKDLTLTDDNYSNAQSMVTINSNGSTVNLDNVKVENGNSSSATGLISLQAGNLNANNLTATADDNNGNTKAVYVNSNNAKFTGETNANIYLTNNATLDGSTVTPESNVVISMASDRSKDTPVVTGITEDNKNSFSTADDKLGFYTPNLEDGSLYYTDDHNVSGVESVFEDLNEVVDVYNLQGLKVRSAVRAGEAAAELPAGLYIFGGKKVLVK